MLCQTDDKSNNQPTDIRVQKDVLFQTNTVVLHFNLKLSLVLFVFYCIVLSPVMLTLLSL